MIQIANNMQKKILIIKSFKKQSLIKKILRIMADKEKTF